MNDESTLHAMKILVIEDDPDDFILLRDMIMDLYSSVTEVEVQWARKAVDGVQALSKGGHDICFLDNRLGTDTGLDILERTSGHRHAPVVMLTGQQNYEIDNAALAAGAADFIAKQELNPSVLDRKIRYTLAHDRVDSALRRSEQFLGNVLDALWYHIAVLDGSGIIIAVNEAWRRFADANGLPASAAYCVGDNYLDVCTQALGADMKSASRAAAGIRAVIDRSRPSFALEYTCDSPDEKRWFVLRVSPFNSDGVGGAVVAHVDVSERNRAEENRRKSERRYRRLVEEIEAIVWEMDDQGTFTFVSSKAEQILGYPVSDWLEIKDFWADTIVHPDDREFAVEYCRNAREKGVDHEFEYRAVAKDGRVICLRDTVRVVHAEHGVKGMRGVIVDITAMKSTEEALRQSDRQFRALIEQLPDAVLVHAEGRILFANPPALVLAGGSLEEVQGHSVLDYVHPDDRAFAISRLHLVADRRQVVPMAPLRVVSAHGIVRYGESMSIPTRYQNVDAVQTVIRDVTERVLTEEQLRQSQKMEAIGHLAGGIAHDFNNVLTAVQGNLELALHSESCGAEAAADIREAMRSAARAALLTRQLLAFSRQQVLRPVALDLNAVVVDIQTMLQRLIGEHIELTTDLDPLLGTVSADPGQIHQVLLNLCVNARDAMPKGGHINIETRNVELGPEFIARFAYPVEAGSFVSLSVSDTGCGMSQALQAQIFEPFFTTKEAGKGTGLGLSTTYGIVKQSGGQIWVYSDIGAGTTFKVYLPRVTSSLESFFQPAPATRARRTVGRTILVIEDEPAVRTLVRRILTRAGHTVIEAGDARAAKSIAQSCTERIDIILSDVVLPGGVSGLDAVNAVKQIWDDAAVIMMSGYTRDEVVRRGVVAQEFHFLEKPFTPAELLNAIEMVDI